MLRAARDKLKRTPIIGPYLHDLYLKAIKNEGEILTIRSGILAGGKWVRFMRTHNDQYINGTYEPKLQSAIAEYLQPGMVFYDVGANAGFFSILASELVGQTGRVIAFEPHPKTVKQLNAQIAINNAKNIDIVRSAVCNKIGYAEFSDDTTSVGASLGESSARTITVKTTTLDQEAERRPPPSLIKIDVEGAEIDVICGARRLISNKKPVLLVELHSYDIAIKYGSIMADFGYSTFDLNGKPFSVNATEERSFVLSKTK
jgi:FkbM family methyltransferase